MNLKVKRSFYLFFLIIFILISFTSLNTSQVKAETISNVEKWFVAGSENGKKTDRWGYNDFKGNWIGTIEINSPDVVYELPAVFRANDSNKESYGSELVKVIDLVGIGSNSNPSGFWEWKEVKQINFIENESNDSYFIYEIILNSNNEYYWKNYSQTKINFKIKVKRYIVHDDKDSVDLPSTNININEEVKSINNEVITDRSTLLAGDNYIFEEGTTKWSWRPDENNTLKRFTWLDTVRNYRNTYVLGMASDFSVFLNGNFTVYQSDSEGRIAIGGKINNQANFEGQETEFSPYQIGMGDYLHSTPLNLLLGRRGQATIITNGIDENSKPLGNRYYNYLMENMGIKDRYQETSTELYSSEKRVVINSAEGSVDQENAIRILESYNNSEINSDKDKYINEDQIFKAPYLIDFNDSFSYLKEVSRELANNENDLVAFQKDGKLYIEPKFGKTIQNKESLYITLTEEQFNLFANVDEIHFQNIPSMRREVTDSLGNTYVWEKAPVFIVINIKKNTTDPNEVNNLFIEKNKYSYSVSQGGWDKKIYFDGYGDNNSNLLVSGQESVNNHVGVSGILFNFADAQEVILGGNFGGTVFAPYADVTDHQYKVLQLNNYSYQNKRGHLSGALIANSFTGYTEFGYRPFNATTNEILPGDLGILKIAIDENGEAVEFQNNEEKYYNFIIYGNNQELNNKTYHALGVTGHSVTFTSTENEKYPYQAPVTIKEGNTAYIYRLPKGQYKVVESEQSENSVSGYVFKNTTYGNNNSAEPEEKNLTDNSKVEFEVTNVYTKNELPPEESEQPDTSIKPVGVIIEGTKNYEGGSLEDNQFNFKLVALNEDKSEILDNVRIASNNQDGNFGFPELTFNQEGIYYYAVKEVEGTDSSITYDNTVYYVQIIVSKVDGELKATTTYTIASENPNEEVVSVEKIVFTNTKITSNPDPEPNPDENSISVGFVIKKVIESEENLSLGIRENDYQFLISSMNNSNSDPLNGETIVYTRGPSFGNQLVGNQELMTVENLKYTQEGIYRYTIQEVIPENRIPGITYDTEVHELVIFIRNSESESNQLRANATLDGKYFELINGSDQFISLEVPEQETIEDETVKGDPTEEEFDEIGDSIDEGQQGENFDESDNLVDGEQQGEDFSEVGDSTDEDQQGEDFSEVGDSTDEDQQEENFDGSDNPIDEEQQGEDSNEVGDFTDEGQQGENFDESGNPVDGELSEGTDIGNDGPLEENTELNNVYEVRLSAFRLFNNTGLLGRLARNIESVESSSVIEFVNRYNPEPDTDETDPKVGGLTVSKTVTGTAGETDKVFTFTVELSDKNVSGSYGNMIFEDGVAIVKLKHGESATATKLSAGVTYTVTESDNDGYTVTPENGVITGSIIDNVTAEAAFNNHKDVSDEPTEEPEVTVGNLTVNKIVTGEAGETEKDFIFTVTLSDETVNGTFGEMTFKDGTATFTLKHNQTVAATNLPAGLTYAVGESDNEGYEVTAVGDTGTVEAGKTAQVSFVNHKDEEPTDDTEAPEKENPNLVLIKEQSKQGGNRTQLSLIVEGNSYVTYYLTVKNTGTGIAKNVVVTDPIQPDLEVLGNTISHNGKVENGIIVWKLGDLKSNEAVTVSFMIRVPEVDETTTWTNIAGTHADNVPNVHSNEVKITEKVKGSIDEVEPPVEIPQLSIHKTQTLTTDNYTDEYLQYDSNNNLITYAIEVENVSATTATNIVITDTVPAGTTFVTGSDFPEAVVNNNVITWTLEELGPNEVVTVYFSVFVDEGITEVENTASLTFAEGSPLTSNKVTAGSEEEPEDSTEAPEWPSEPEEPDNVEPETPDEPSEDITESPSTTPENVEKPAEEIENTVPTTNSVGTTPSKSTSSVSNVAPKTGITTSIVLWIALVVLAGIALVAVNYNKRRNKN